MLGILRRILELASRNQVLKRHIRACGKRTPLFVSPDAQLKYLKPGAGSFDGDLISIAENFSNEDIFVWDIGANVGVYSVAALASSPETRVLAVEADPWLATVLKRTSELSNYSDRDFFVLSAAIADQIHVAEFLIAERGRASNSLAQFGGRSQMGGVRLTQLVPVLTIDILAEHLGSPDFIKIDVEGAEYSVLQGGIKTLSSDFPAIYVETSEDTFHQCKKFLIPLGYRLFGSDGIETSSHQSNCFFIHEDDDLHMNKMRAFRLGANNK